MARAVHISSGGTSGALTASFVPERSMFGAALRYRGDNLLTRAGLPLLHPWANRLSKWSYTAAGRRVRLRGVALPHDSNGLPIHGVPDLPFAVVAQSRNKLIARLDSRESALLTRAFPFPHTLTVAARVDAKSLRITTTLIPTSDRPVPVSFGWHPYFRIPGVARREWMLGLPACTHVALGADQLPLGTEEAQPARTAALRTERYDDHYALGRTRRFTLAGGRRTITVAFSPAYQYAQVYAPPQRALVSIEPMTAPVDALGRGTAPLVQPEQRFTASFTVSVA